MKKVTMKKIILIFSIFLISWIPEMSYSKTLTCTSSQSIIDPQGQADFLSNSQNTQCITKVTTEAELKQYLKDDKTNRVNYNENLGNAEKWFICTHFSTMLTLRLGCFHIDQSYQGIEHRTKIKFSDSPLKDLPLFMFSFMGKYENETQNKNNPFPGHMINALYNPISSGGLDDLSNYTFTEPQKDKVYQSIENVMDDWGLVVLEGEIIVTDEVRETARCRPQYGTRAIRRFQCKLE